MTFSIDHHNHNHYHLYLYLCQLINLYIYVINHIINFLDLFEKIRYIQKKH